jgi:hypothetical protein
MALIRSLGDSRIRTWGVLHNSERERELQRASDARLPSAHSVASIQRAEVRNVFGFPVAKQHNAEWQGGLWMECLRKTTRNLSQDSRCPCRHWNWAPAEFGCGQVGTTAGLHAGGMGSNLGPRPPIANEILSIIPVKLGHDHFILHHFQYTIHLTFRCCEVSTLTVSQNKPTCKIAQYV